MYIDEMDVQIEGENLLGPSLDTSGAVQPWKPASEKISRMPTGTGVLPPTVLSILQSHSASLLCILWTIVSSPAGGGCSQL